MLEVEALDFIETFPEYETFRKEEKAILITKYSALVGTTTDSEFESIYKDTYDFIMQTIYNYYDNYYLTSASKDRFLTLLGTIISGKLPAYKVRYDNYLNARKLVYDNLTSRESSSSSTGSESGSGEQNYKNNKSGSRNSSGSSKYADTPENINASEDFVDEYTTGASKDTNSSSHTDISTTETDFSNKRSKSDTKSYNETLKGGAKQLWENVQAIPSEIYKEVITITAKLFFTETMEERTYPCAYLTLTAKVKTLEQKDITGYSQELLDTYELVSTINTGEKDYTATTSLKVFKDIADAYYLENKGRIDTLTGRVDNIESDIEVINSKVAKNTQDIATNKANIETNTSDIESLKVRTTKNENDIDSLDATLKTSVKEVEHTYDTSTRKLQLTYTLNNGTKKTSTLTLPEVTLTSSGLMTPTLFSKLDQVVLYGTNYITTGRKFGVRKDEDNDLYVEVPEGESYTLPVATKDTLGGVKQGKNITIDADGTINGADAEGFTAGDGLETTSGVTKVKTDSLTTGFNSNKQIEVLTDGESIQAGANGLEVKVDGSTIKIGDNGLEAVGGSSGGVLEEVKQDIPLWTVYSNTTSAAPIKAVDSSFTKGDTSNREYYIYLTKTSIGFYSTSFNTTSQKVTLTDMPIEDYVCVLFKLTFESNNYLYLIYTENRLFAIISLSNGKEYVIECDKDTLYYKIYTIGSVSYLWGFQVNRLSQGEDTYSYTAASSETTKFSTNDYIPTYYYMYNLIIASGLRYNYFATTYNVSQGNEIVYKVKKDNPYVSQ